MDGLFISFERFPQWDKQEGPNLRFNLVSLKWSLNADTMTVERFK